jgi:manganese/zinc/iron transport system substrate-binding protein
MNLFKFFNFNIMKRFYFFTIILFNIFLFNFNYIKYNNSKINILVTTSIIGDITKNLVKNFANIFTLMGQGVDPHLYKATQGDLYKINNSDIIFYNGLFLEGKMSDIFNKLNKFKKIYAISDGILSFELIKDPNFSNGLDPHI